MMMTPPPNEVTQLLREWSQGDQDAPEKLMPVVYAELRRMAHSSMAGQNRGHTLQTTALIHEAYLRLVNQSEKQWKDRSHFFAVAAQAMRHILVDFARSKQAKKHGGGARQGSVDEEVTGSEEREAEVCAVEDALKEVYRVSTRTC